MRTGSRLAARDGQVVIANLEGAETALSEAVGSLDLRGPYVRVPMILGVTRGTSWLQETRLEEWGRRLLVGRTAGGASEGQS